MRYVAHGYFAYGNEISFAYPEHLEHGGVAFILDFDREYTQQCNEVKVPVLSIL